MIRLLQKPSTLVVFILLILFLRPLSIVLAIDSPILVSPNDFQTVSKSTLEWQSPSQELYATNPFRIQVDNDSSFLSPEKDYATSNTKYTPSLSEGLWNWRVKAKDKTGNWSNWSGQRSFTLTTNLPTIPEPQTSIQTPYPTSDTKTTSSFVISALPTSLAITDSFSPTIQISSSPNITYYLKGAFAKTGSSNYFGKTKVSGSWVLNNQSYSDQIKIVTDANGSWSGSIEIMPDGEDSGYTGSGEYIFKVGRYNSSGSSLIWSNQSLINLSGSIPSSKTTATAKPTTVKTSATPVITTAKVSSGSIIPPTTTKLAANTPDEASSETDIDINALNDQILGTASSSLSPSPEILVKDDSRRTGINIFFIIIGLFILSIGGATFYLSRKPFLNP